MGEDSNEASPPTNCLLHIPYYESRFPLIIASGATGANGPVVCLAQLAGLCVLDLATQTSITPDSIWYHRKSEQAFSATTAGCVTQNERTTAIISPMSGGGKVRPAFCNRSGTTARAGVWPRRPAISGCAVDPADAGPAGGHASSHTGYPCAPNPGCRKVLGNSTTHNRCQAVSGYP